MTVEGGESGRFDDGLSATGADQLMADVFGDLRVRQARKGVVDGDALAQSFMDRFSQGIVEIRLAAEDQGKTVDRVIAVIHQHFKGDHLFPTGVGPPPSGQAGFRGPLTGLIPAALVVNITGPYSSLNRF